MTPIMKALILPLLVILLRASSANADPISISTLWNWGGATTNQQAQISSVWSSVVSYYQNTFAASYSGETWTINANWTTFSNSAIANCGPSGWVSGATLATLTNANTNLINTDVWYANAEANQVARQAYTNGSSMTLNINMNTTWDWSTTNKASGTESFYTTAIHEIGHGLGFLSDINTNTGAYNGGATAFDAYLTLGTGTNYLISMTNNADRLAAITSANIYFNGYNATNNLGGPVSIYAPSAYEDGSSMSHLNTNVSLTQSLIMYPSATTNPENFSYSSMELGIYQDLGYSITAVPESSSGILILFGSGVLVLTWRFRRMATC